LSLENVKVGIGEDKIKEVKVALEKAKAGILEEKIPEIEKQAETLKLDWGAMPLLIDGGSRQTAFLSALANADPRACFIPNGLSGTRNEDQRLKRARVLRGRQPS
jgi:hypothetical protein